MIETTVIKHLSNALRVPVYAERPEKPEESYVIVEKTGSSRTNYVDHAMIAIQSYAATMLGAAELNEEVKAAMDDLISIDKVSESRLNSDSNFTDISTKQYRYQAVYDITYLQ